MALDFVTGFPSLDNNTVMLILVEDDCHPVCSEQFSLMFYFGNKQLADRRSTPVPTYLPSQRVWLSAKDIPLRTESKKLSPRYIGPFPITSIVNPLTVKL